MAEPPRYVAQDISPAASAPVKRRDGQPGPAAPGGATQAITPLRASTARERGKTVIVMLHEVNFTARHSHRIAAMRQGRIPAAGRRASG